MTNFLQATTLIFGHSDSSISRNIYAKINFKIICDTGVLEIIWGVIYCQYSMSELNYYKLLIMAEEIQTLNTSHSMLSGSKEQKTIQVLRTAPYVTIQCLSLCTNWPYAQKWSNHGPRREGWIYRLPFPMCSTLLMLCQITGPQFSMLRSSHNKGVYCTWPALFYWKAEVVLSAWNWGSRKGWPLNERGLPAAWTGLIRWCHRKRTLSLSRVKDKIQQQLQLFSDVIGWSFRTGTHSSP